MPPPPAEPPREAPRPVFGFALVFRFAVGLDAVERVAEPVDFARDAAVPDFAVVARAPVLLAAPLLRAVDPDPARPEDARLPDLVPPSELSSSPIHLPDITRWAASATASAISEPSLVALDIMLLAALLALSAASIPASRIARRAFGLAAIAAAAAVSPAASISLLIAALVILSIVESLDPDEEREDVPDPPEADAEDLVPADFVPEDRAPDDFFVVLRFAIGFPPWCRGKDTSGPKRFRRHDSLA